MAGRTRPEGYPLIQDLTEKKYKPSATFVTSISVLLGVIIAMGMILGVVGDAFYVSRTEYTIKNLKDTETAATFNSTLLQLKDAMSAQTASFKEMSGKIENIRVEISSKRK
jgi:ABC-type siderophore export system fused ATPase/permease subunit